MCLIRQKLRPDKQGLIKNLAIFASDEKHRKVIQVSLIKDYYYCHNGN
jgi:hypothetical protein